RRARLDRGVRRFRSAATPPGPPSTARRGTAAAESASPPTQCTPPPRLGPVRHQPDSATGSRSETMGRGSTSGTAERGPPRLAVPNLGRESMRLTRVRVRRGRIVVAAAGLLVAATVVFGTTSIASAAPRGRVLRVGTFDGIKGQYTSISDAVASAK